MLNLGFIFDDATHALSRYAEDLAVVQLPAAVYMMQVDVINHYDHALKHYLTVPLDAPFLQDSSLGTPYQKWAFFTNDDFKGLSFAVHNLLRYTSRLLHETEFLVLTRSRSLELVRAIKSNSYTTPIGELRNPNKSIGVTVHGDHSLSIAAMSTRPSVEGVDDEDDEDDEEVDEAENARRGQLTKIQVETIDIRDRSRLVTLQERGRLEIAALRGCNRVFAEACDVFYQSRRVVQPFENLNQSYWI